ncbi:MAG: hypothetical protein FWB80_14795 [Defluviitaleaceae bacterium]|nr:hypothetical protein [Defluviitaleaceae bacterium]
MSKIINRALLIEQIKRFWAIPALSALIYILAIYMPMRTEISDWWTMRRFIDIVIMGNALQLFNMVLTPVVAAFCTFGMFFNKKAATAFYSMPLSKNQLFATNALAGIILSVIPVLVFSLVLLLPIHVQDVAGNVNHLLYAVGTFRGAGGGSWSQTAAVPLTALPGGFVEGARANAFPVIFSLFMQMSLASIFYFAVAWLAFSMAGHGFVALCLVAVLPFVPTLAITFVQAVLQLFVYGFAGGFTTGIFVFDEFLAYHNPAVWSVFIRHGTLSRMEGIYIPALIYIVIAVALFAAAWFVSRARKTERTGNSVIFNPVKHVLVFVFSFIGMIIMGAIFYDTSMSIANMYVGFVVGFALAYIVAQMIAEKSFMVLGKMRYLPIFGGTAAGIYVVILIVTQFGLGFYVNRIPARDEVYAVFVTNWFVGSGITEEEWRRISVTDPHVIEATRTAHQKMLDGRRDLHEIPNIRRGLTYTSPQLDGTIRTRENLIFRYILNDGRVIQRQYTVTGDFIESAGLTEFLTSELVVLAPYVFFRIPEEIDHIVLSFSLPEFNPELGQYVWSRGDWERIIITNRAEINLALALIKQITMENAVEVRQSSPSIAEWEHREWLANDLMWMSPTMQPTLHMSLPNIPRVEESGRWSRLPWWNTPHLQGEAITRLLELIDEHGLGEREEREMRVIQY